MAPSWACRSWWSATPTPEDGVPTGATTGYVRCRRGGRPGPESWCRCSVSTGLDRDPVEPVRPVLRHRAAGGRGARATGGVGGRTGRGPRERRRPTPGDHGRRVGRALHPRGRGLGVARRPGSRSERADRKVLRLQKGEVWVVQSTGSSLAIVRAPPTTARAGQEAAGESADHYAGGVMHAPNRFEPASVGVFRVTDRAFDRDTGAVSLHYALDDRTRSSRPSPSRPRSLRGPASTAPGWSGPCCTSTSPPAPATTRRPHRRWWPSRTSGLLPVEHDVPPPSLRRRPPRVRRGQRATRAPTGGGQVRSRHRADRPAPGGAPRPGGLVVPIGGGKDSMVLIEAVKHLHPRLFAVNPHPWSSTWPSSPASS